MQQPSESTKLAQPVEQTFGAEVARLRSLLDMSQRAFATKLTERGMAVDASAVSRIESGARALRLSEALIISDVLNVDIDMLISGARTDAQEFRSIRRLADLTMGQLQDAALDFLAAFSNVSDFLNEHPELLVELEDENVGKPETPRDYLKWVGQRMENLKERHDQFRVVVEDEAEAEALNKLIRDYVSGFVTVREDGQADGEHTEA